MRSISNRYSIGAEFDLQSPDVVDFCCRCVLYVLSVKHAFAYFVRFYFAGLLLLFASERLVCERG